MKDFVLTCVATLLVMTPTLALAQTAVAPQESAEVSSDPSAAPPPVGKIHLVSQAAPSGNSRTFHRHDGFYLRTNFGYGISWASFNDDGPGKAAFSANGGGLALDLLVGGSPSPGFVLGGGLLGNWIFSADFESDDGAAIDTRNVSSTLLGVFADGFPQGTGGFHIGGLLGLSVLTLGKGAQPGSTMGLGGAAWLGYDQWVGDDWGLGGLVRFTAAQSVGEEGPVDLTASHASLTLLFSALYH